MSVQCEVAARPAAAMNLFERYLTLWVALCIVLGVALGQWLPGVFQAVARLEVAQVNLPVGVLIWVMIIPMLVKVDFAAVHQVRQHVRGIGVTLFVNWLVKPFSMALLGWLFVRQLFAPWLPAEQLDSYIAGLILLAAAPCTAMVFVWSRLTQGDPLFTLSQVALNDVIMVLAFAPLVGLLLGVSAIAVPWDTLLTSVLLYIVAPVLLAQLWRRALLARGQAAFDAAMARIGPWSMAALLLTLVLLFAFQGEAILRQPLVIALLAVPILLQVLFNSALAYWLNRALGEQHCVAGPSALIGASNFFELAVACSRARILAQICKTFGRQKPQKNAAKNSAKKPRLLLAGESRSETPPHQRRMKRIQKSTAAHSQHSATTCIARACTPNIMQPTITPGTRPSSPVNWPAAARKT